MTHRTGALTSGWSIHYSLGRRGRAGVSGGEDEGLRAEARRALSDGRVAVAGWLLLAGCELGAMHEPCCTYVRTRCMSVPEEPVSGHSVNRVTELNYTRVVLLGWAIDFR